VASAWHCIGVGQVSPPVHESAHFMPVSNMKHVGWAVPPGAASQTEVSMHVVVQKPCSHDVSPTQSTALSQAEYMPSSGCSVPALVADPLVGSPEPEDATEDVSDVVSASPLDGLSLDAELSSSSTSVALPLDALDDIVIGVDVIPNVPNVVAPPSPPSPTEHAARASALAIHIGRTRHAFNTETS
jgi:hypothetical protein